MPAASRRLHSIPVSAVRQLAAFAGPVRQKGVKIYHLNIGDPDIKTPDCMIDVLKNWDKNPIGYTDSKGNADFIDAMVVYYHRLGYDEVAAADIIATVGGSEAVTMSFLSVADEGEEVLVFEPFYSNYAACATIAGVKLVGIPTDIKTGFHLPPPAAIEAKITPRTKAMLICSPGNPTGTVYTKNEIAALAGLAKKHNLFIISDEVYREYVFDGKTHESMIPFMRTMPENIIILDSLSKRYSLCGARLGTLMTKNRELWEGALKIAQARLSGAMIGQKIGARMNEVPADYIAAVQTEYQKRRDVLYGGLTAIPGVTTYKPEGAFYLMAALPINDGFEFCKWLLTEFQSKNETVMLAPGAGFYATEEMGKNEVRLAYVLKIDDLKRALEILRDGLEAYHR